MAIELEREPAFAVGGATIDPVSREATFAGGQERLQPQTLKVLIALARRKNQVVTRSELVESCWDGKIIGDDVINRSILMLRQFAERVGGFSIETVPKSGYRLVEAGTGPKSGSNRWKAAAAALVLIVAAAALVLWQPWASSSVTTVAVTEAD